MKAVYSVMLESDSRLMIAARSTRYEQDELRGTAARDRRDAQVPSRVCYMSDGVECSRVSLLLLIQQTRKY